VTLLAACSALPPEPGSARDGERIYRTGSNLPQKDRSINDVVVVDPAAMQNSISRSAGTMGSPRP
jgi:hypothetical protein